MRRLAISRQIVVALLIAAAATLSGPGCEGRSTETVDAPGEHPARGQWEAACKAEHGSADDFDLSVTAPDVARVDAPLRAKIEVRPRAPFKHNTRFPTELKLSASDGVRLGRQSVKIAAMARAAGRKLTIQVPYQVIAKGDHKVTGALSFGLCSAETCRAAEACIHWRTQVN